MPEMPSMPLFYVLHPTTPQFQEQCAKKTAFLPQLIIFWSRIHFKSLN